MDHCDSIASVPIAAASLPKQTNNQSTVAWRAWERPGRHHCDSIASVTIAEPVVLGSLIARRAAGHA